MMSNRFMITIEVVPPVGNEANAVLSALKTLQDLPFDGFSVATNPVAKPYMSALALCTLIQQHTSKQATLHCTTRDHNRLSLQSLLWGARALGIESVLAMTGDFVALEERHRTTTLRDLDVFDLIRMAREADLRTGVVCDISEDTKHQEHALRRLEKKLATGAQFVVTQPIYDQRVAETLATLVNPLKIPVIMGILPLRSFRHAEFLHAKVAGIDVPAHVRNRMAGARDPVAEGIANARDMLDIARRSFAGVCLMPPFSHYEILSTILR